MGANVERAGSAGINKKHQVLVAQIRRGNGVSPRSVPHAPPLIHAIPEGGLQQFGAQIDIQGTDRGAEGVKWGSTFWEQPGSHGTGDRHTGTGRGDRSGCGKSTGIGKGKILGNRFLDQLGQASVRQANYIAK